MSGLVFLMAVDKETLAVSSINCDAACCCSKHIPHDMGTWPDRKTNKEVGAADEEL